MRINTFLVVALIAAALTSAAGCVSTDRLKTISAGHTGCLPDQIDITNVTETSDGGATWNATCKGQIYLCSGASAGQSVTFSCAPAVK